MTHEVNDIVTTETMFIPATNSLATDFYVKCISQILMYVKHR